MYCPNCGAEVDDNLKFCVYCGAKLMKPDDKSLSDTDISNKSESRLFDAENFQDNSQSTKYTSNQFDSTEAEDAVEMGSFRSENDSWNDVDDDTNAYKKQAVKMKTKRKSPIKNILIVVGIVVLVLVAFFAGMIVGSHNSGFSGNKKGPDFQAVYEEFCDPIWATVGSDNSYLAIDTNPYNEDDAGIAYSAALLAILNVNDALGLPESLYNEMRETTALMGRQSETFSDLGIEVTWTYHPNNGLEVTYKNNN